MAATRQDIEEWFREGVRAGQTHLIVMCDMFAHEDFPVYVAPGNSPRDVAKEHTKATAQRPTEVYNLKMDMEEQFNSKRAKDY